MRATKPLLRVSDLEDRQVPAAIILNRPFASNEIIALLRANNAIPRIAAIDNANSRVIFHGSDSTLVRARLAAGANPIAVANELASSPDVLWASPNYIYTSLSEFMPNDPLFSQQYHLSKMQTQTAWDT